MKANDRNDSNGNVENCGENNDVHETWTCFLRWCMDETLLNQMNNNLKITKRRAVSVASFAIESEMEH